MPNYNPETGIPYGYISAHSMDDEVVHELMYGSQAVDHGYEDAKLDYINLHPEDPDALYFDYQCDEPIVTGEYEGVRYRSSWMGGALCFFIFASPRTGEYRICSPCVPGAGDLNSPYEGGGGSVVTCYDIPTDWRKAP